MTEGTKRNKVASMIKDISKVRDQEIYIVTDDIIATVSDEYHRIIKDIDLLVRTFEERESIIPLWYYGLMNMLKQFVKDAEELKARRAS